ncbi:hypothetical protein BaRGS_00026929 [Batillaria attramentaria]|uniref:Protein kinase domain-containing protein n=1 Tax=Batillaria attramentaria TaxID=370345 RepID=A0ABD0K406_9CAEN
MSSLCPPSIPRIRSFTDLSQINDLSTALAVMQQLNIDMDGVCDTQDALARIRDKFSKSQAREIYNEQDRVLKEAVSADHSNRQAMSQLFNQARDYLQTLPAHFQTDLQHVFPDFLHKLDDTVQQLKNSDCTILVAGETGSGKSSLVNLVAGCQILPTDLIQGTKTICELRHSETRKFVAHPWDQKHGVLARECKQESDVERFLKELKHHVTYADMQTDESPYEKIEIYWPLPILGEGVVMVDSPGVGESRKLSKQLESYMTRAYGFIYVINISNAGGIHRNRLGQLLRQAVERSVTGFDPTTALFVCNWWDQVAPREQEHVIKVTLDRLSKILAGVRRDQVYPFSSTAALRAVEAGNILDEYRALVEGIRNVLPRTFNAKLSTYYSWLSGVLKRSLYSVKISTNIGRKQMEEKEATYYSVRNQIEALERDAEDRIDVMRSGFKREVDSITRKLITHLKTDGMRKLTTWSPHDCPAPERKWQNVAKEAASKFAERLASVVNDWEQQNKMVGKIRSNILKGFQRDLDLFEDQIKQLEGVLFEGMDKRIVTDFHSSMRHARPVQNVFRKARRDGESGFLSLGTAISGCRTADVKSNALKPVFRSYDSRNPNAMAEASKLFLDQIKEEDIVSATKKFFERIAKRFDAASRLLPEFLKADRSLLQTLQGEVKGEQERLVSMYPQLLASCSQLQGKLDMFFVQRLMSFEFHMKELKYDMTRPLGTGSFADVFRSKVPGPEGQSIPVALKIQREKLTPKNVTDVLLEDRTLRDIRHENIIRYYGAARERQGNDMRWVMVMEYCTRTIKQRFISDPEARVPGRVEIASLRVDAMREVAHFALQICSALCYLHNRGIVHRDLKPDNILLTESDVVKLTDVGLAKRVIDIAGSLAGTPVYMAPEVLLQHGVYDMRADIYSLAIILWELWYGQDAADHIGSHLFGRLEDAVKVGLRPSITMAHTPPEDWVALLQSGWEFEAAKRPSSNEVLDFFERFLKSSSG